MLDLEDSGRQIGEKLLSLLSPNQKKELAQFVRDYEAGDIPMTAATRDASPNAVSVC